MSEPDISSNGAVIRQGVRTASPRSTAPLMVPLFVSMSVASSTEDGVAIRVALVIVSRNDAVVFDGILRAFTKKVDHRVRIINDYILIIIIHLINSNRPYVISIRDLPTKAI